MTGTNKPALPISSSWRHPGVNVLNKTKKQETLMPKNPRVGAVSKEDFLNLKEKFHLLG